MNNNPYQKSSGNKPLDFSKVADKAATFLGYAIVAFQVLQFARDKFNEVKTGNFDIQKEVEND